MSADRGGAIGRSRGGGGPLRVAATTAFTAALTFEAFRIVDRLKLIPADPETRMVLSVAAAAVAGGAAAAVQLLRVETRRARLFLLTLVVSGAVLLGLHAAFVFPGPVRQGKRLGSVVVSWSRAGCENCAGLSRDQCLGKLAWDQDDIDACWGAGRVLAVRLALILCALAVSGGFGGSVAFGALAWRRRKGKDEPHALRLFLCYRRADSATVVDPLHARLSERFGAGNVFRDVEDIQLGGDFRQAVRRALARCDVFLLVIGPRWLEIRDDEGARRLDDADDPVRIEVESAIARGLLVVPVLVGGARMPRSDQMPDGFEELSNRAGAAIQGDPAAPGEAAFAASVDELIRQLEQAHELEPARGNGGAEGPAA